MKKKSIFAIILGGCICLGLILTIIALALGVSTFTVVSRDNKTEAEEPSVSHNIEAYTPKDFSKIENLEFDLSAGEIKIVQGDDFSVSGASLSKNECKNGTWYLTSRLLSKKRRIIRFFDLNIPVFSSRSQSRNITVTLPKDIKLKHVNFSFSAVSTDISALNCDDISLDLSAGGITFKELTAKKAVLNASAGSIALDRYNIEDSADIDCSTGEIRLGKSDFVSSNTINNADISCALGSLKLYGKLTGENDLTCSLGDIELFLPGSRTNYEFPSQQASLGSIDFHNDNTAVSSEVFGKINLDCSLGGIDVKFK